VPVSVRVREPGDLVSCVEALARVHATSGYPTNWPADPPRWLTPSGLIEAWVAGTKETPVAGHAIVSKLPEPAGDRAAVEFGRLFVDPAARRQGVAQVLIQHAKDWAASRDLDLMLWVTDQLTPAQKLYTSAGFTRTGTEVASWTSPDGGPVTVHRYDWTQVERGTLGNR
jgi:GNAT superfamily N-acetyltransferase